MPLFLHRYLRPFGEVGIWEITEGENYFQQRLVLTEEEEAQLAVIKGRRRTEWLAARQLLHLMSGRDRRASFYKDENGKPHLHNANYQISISHSHSMAAAITAPVAVGIDIQFLVPKIERIAHKFLSEQERIHISSELRIEQLHVYWGAKEALYKAYGRKQLDLCRHILIEPFNLDYEAGYCEGRILKDDFLATFNIHYEKIGRYILVYAIAKQPDRKL